MTMKEFRDITELARKISKDKERLYYLQEKAICIPSSSNISGDKVQNTIQNRAGMYVDAAVDLEREIAMKESELRSMQARAEVEIERVDDVVAKKILRERYLNLQTWELIADVLGYTVRRIHQIENKALSSIS